MNSYLSKIDDIDKTNINSGFEPISFDDIQKYYFSEKEKDITADVYLTKNQISALKRVIKNNKNDNIHAPMGSILIQDKKNKKCWYLRGHVKGSGSYGSVLEIPYKITFINNDMVKLTRVHYVEKKQNLVSEIEIRELEKKINTARIKKRLFIWSKSVLAVDLENDEKEFQLKIKERENKIVRLEKEKQNHEEFNSIVVCDQIKSDSYSILMEDSGISLKDFFDKRAIYKTDAERFDGLVNIALIIATRIGFVHKSAMVHHDLKPENICIQFESSCCYIVTNQDPNTLLISEEGIPFEPENALIKYKDHFFYYNKNTKSLTAIDGMYNLQLKIALSKKQSDNKNSLKNDELEIIGKILKQPNFGKSSRQCLVGLIDFGTTKELDDVPKESTEKVGGTEIYIALERYKNDEKKVVDSTPASDWFSFGIILAQLFTQNPYKPVRRKEEKKRDPKSRSYKDVCKEPLDFTINDLNEYFPNVSREKLQQLFELILDLHKENYEERPKFEVIKKTLADLIKESDLEEKNVISNNEIIIEELSENGLNENNILTVSNQTHFVIQNNASQSQKSSMTTLDKLLTNFVIDSDKYRDMVIKSFVDLYNKAKSIALEVEEIENKEMGSTKDNKVIISDYKIYPHLQHLLYQELKSLDLNKKPGLLDDIKVKLSELKGKDQNDNQIITLVNTLLFRKFEENTIDKRNRIFNKIESEHKNKKSNLFRNQKKKWTEGFMQDIENTIVDNNELSVAFNTRENIRKNNNIHANFDRVELCQALEELDLVDNKNRTYTFHDEDRFGSHLEATGLLFDKNKCKISEILKHDTALFHSESKLFIYSDPITKKRSDAFRCYDFNNLTSANREELFAKQEELQDDKSQYRTFVLHSAKPLVEYLHAKEKLINTLNDNKIDYDLKTHAHKILKETDALRKSDRKASLYELTNVLKVTTKTVKNPSLENAQACLNQGNKFTKSNVGKVVGGLVLALAGIAAIVASVTIAAATLGTLSPASSIGVWAGVTLITTGIGAVLGVGATVAGGKLIHKGLIGEQWRLRREIKNLANKAVEKEIHKDSFNKTK